MIDLPKLALLVVLLGAGGCGQTGPLYLPGTAPPVSEPEPPAEEDRNEEEDEDAR